MKIHLLIQRQEDLKQHFEHLLVTLSQEVAAAVLSMVVMVKIVAHLQDLVAEDLVDQVVQELEMVLHSQEQLALLHQMVGDIMVALVLVTKVVEVVVQALLVKIHPQLPVEMVVQVSKFQQHSDILLFL